MRILHTVGVMAPGGIEIWLMHILRRIDRDQFQMDFLVHKPLIGRFDDEIRSLGSQIIPCPPTIRRPWVYYRHLKQVLQEHGRYDILHCHLQHFCGLSVTVARGLGVPVCIVHSHLDTGQLKTTANLKRRSYYAVTDRLIHQYATYGLAASEHAACALFGENWRSDPRWRILYYGIDLAPFRAAPDPSVRPELGIPDDAFVVGNVARFSPQKNHLFLIKIAQQVIQRQPKAYFLLVGDGQVRPQVEQLVQEMGLAQNVIFTGVRSDVPRLLLNAMDVFLLPSLFEGLPLTLIEAQAAGLPCVISDTITREINIIPPLITRCSLGQPAEAWADAILAYGAAAPAVSRAEALAAIENSPFNILSSLTSLQEIYLGTNSH